MKTVITIEIETKNIYTVFEDGDLNKPFTVEENKEWSKDFHNALIAAVMPLIDEDERLDYFANKPCMDEFFSDDGELADFTFTVTCEKK